ARRRPTKAPKKRDRLILFPFSLEGAAQTWLEKEPPNFITIWNDLVSKFVNQFFPPSITTNLRNDITNFQQKYGETFSEAWEQFKDLLKKCPHHGFSPLHQIDTFYDGLNQSDQDSLNSTTCGNLLTRNTQKALTIIENKSKVRTSRNEPQVSRVNEKKQDEDLETEKKEDIGRTRKKIEEKIKRERIERSKEEDKKEDRDQKKTEEKKEAKEEEKGDKKKEEEEVDREERLEEENKEE
ncbi:reverse transcriptase domain-containing protein, partial [Tanacetum coccineum]